jgi:acyl dehydratase
MIPDDFTVSFNARDSILYALSIGFGSSLERYDEDRRYVYEEDINFAVVPTFAITFTFWANQYRRSIGDIPPFPPPLMSSAGVLPQGCLRNGASIDDLPIIQTEISVVFQNALPVPKSGQTEPMRVSQSFVSVSPKSIGTFVTTETKITNNCHTLCTITSTALVLGVPSSHVNPMQPTDMIREEQHPSKDALHELLVEWDYTVPPNQTLLYRQTSGDSNEIHVNPDALPATLEKQASKIRVDPDSQPDVQKGQDRDDSKRRKLLLHGLSTLGIAVRALIHYTEDNYPGSSLQAVKACFTYPAFVNDRITVKISGAKNDSSLQLGKSVFTFLVLNKTSGKVLLKNGYAEFAWNRSTLQQQSRL